MNTINSPKRKVVTLEALIPTEYELLLLPSKLLEEYSLEVEILRANLKITMWEYKWLHDSQGSENIPCYAHFLKLQIKGNNQQLFQGLSFLAGLGVKFTINSTEYITIRPISVLKPQQSNFVTAA